MPSTPEVNVDGGTRTVELFVRSLAPRAAHDRQEALLERLEQLEARGRIAEYTVHVWGSRIDPSSKAARTDQGRFVRERVEAFLDWAAENGYSTDPFFEEERVESAMTGEEYTARALPSIALAEYVDGDLAFVAPCADGETAHGVGDRLEELADVTPASDDAPPLQTSTN